MSSARGARGSENPYHGKGMNAANVTGDEIRSKTETLLLQREKIVNTNEQLFGKKTLFPKPRQSSIYYISETLKL